MRVLLMIVFLACFVSCKSQQSTEINNRTTEHLGLKYTNSWKAGDNAVTFMAFNVENLFDTKDDKNKDDATYLPLTTKQSQSHKQSCEKLPNPHWKDQCLNWDWSDKVVDKKLTVLSESIKQINSGKGPDILVLEEVENIDILQQLNKKGLNYPTVVLIEGMDKRGIDVAVMTRLNQVRPAKLHTIAFNGFAKERVLDTRGILQVDLALPDGEPLSVFAVHFPAPFHPKEMRKQAFAHLNGLVDALPDGRLAIAAGDFNVPKREDEQDNFVVKSTNQHWIVGHKVACSECPGSTYYPPKDSWSFLDMILWSKSFEAKKAKWQVDRASFRVANNYPEQRSKTGAPKRFEISGPSGVSDHWPLAVDIVPKK